MNFKKAIFHDILDTYLELNPIDKKNFWIMSLSYFLIIFIYPFFRVTSTALYIQTYGAKATPVVEFFSIFALILSIALFNHLQKKWSIHKVFSFANYLSVFLFLCFYGLYLLGIKEGTFVLYIWKEIYIMLLFHQYWGYANNSFSYKEAKIFFGLISAWGSIGGIIGGFLTAYLIKAIGITPTLTIATVFLIINDLVFRRTKSLAKEESYIKDDSLNKPSPIQALGDSRKYVFYIFLIVSLSQFFINIANLQFNLLLEQNAELAVDKAKYLANVFSFTNIIALIFKIFIMPYLLVRVSNKAIQLSIPLLYIFFNFLGMGIGGNLFLLVSGAFIFIKGIDYSCFTMAKEMLYYPLQAMQKYGAKYLIDVFAYRVSKGVISLLLIYYQNIAVLSVVNYIILAVWFYLIFNLFKSLRELPKVEEIVH